MVKRSKSDIGRRAWKILKLALLSARKGGIFVLSKRLTFDISHFVKSLRNSHSHKGRGALHYGDRELSFDATPMIHVKMHRPNSMRFRLPHIPCINPQSDIFDFDDNSSYAYSEARKSFLLGNTEQCYSDYEDKDQDQEDSNCAIVTEHICEEDGIDLKAEEFITNFYEQLKLQRQISHLQYKNNK